MKRLSLSQLRDKQADLAKQIAEADEREKIMIGAYMQGITGECELAGVRAWLDDKASADTARCVQRLHWIIDPSSHVNQVIGIYQDGDDIVVALSDTSNKIRISRYMDMYDLLEQICQGIDAADDWRK